ncbi:unnamed protein product, partial [Amoebophrya sp. A120]|eukprot:GSA120T00026154001.1
MKESSAEDIARQLYKEYLVAVYRGAIDVKKQQNTRIRQGPLLGANTNLAQVTPDWAHFLNVPAKLFPLVMLLIGPDEKLAKCATREFSQFVFTALHQPRMFQLARLFEPSVDRTKRNPASVSAGFELVPSVENSVIRSVPPVLKIPVRVG